MNEALKKAILFTVGAYHLSKEGIEKLVADLEAEGAFDKEEGERLVKEVLGKAAERAEVLSERISKEVAGVLDEVGVTAAQRQELQEKLTAAIHRVMSSAD